MGEFRYINCAGLCVTKPNKVEVLKYLDERDLSVDILGSCNTIRIQDGKYIGYNTDGISFINAIRDDVKLAGGHFFAFGAGGAGQACMIEAAEQGAERIAISNPREEIQKGW